MVKSFAAGAVEVTGVAAEDGVELLLQRCPDAEPYGLTFYTASETLALVRPRWRVVSTVKVRAGVLP